MPRTSEKEFTRGDGTRVRLVYPCTNPDGGHRTLEYVVQFANGTVQKKETDHKDWRVARAAAIECVLSLKRAGFYPATTPRPPASDLEIPYSPLTARLQEARRRLAEERHTQPAITGATPEPATTAPAESIIEQLERAASHPTAQEDPARRILLE